ncbi:FAD-dependent oxidoreductase [Spongiactinospora sp. TRM90649]|uniref:GcvT family protein n=1 Tax=Spongiactinospora sp. TRM90649 TaxID=3031114 RepID=UPI0023F8A619|nr:FAD-dependent oxidoreductase [Spongiactinospora sp. TRM90649]MDF5752490.1 FAD-dependent oxidoreductase [Spongiactinospora sp. TRM90649]
MATVRALPGSARIVVIGGGVGGASIVYHLTELGERDVVLLDRDELTSGSTFHSAGLVGQLRADPALTRMNRYSVELYRRLERGDHPPGWVECGGIRLASSQERMAEIRRQIGWARASGLPLSEISPAEAAELFPLIDTEGVVGGAYLPSDGQVDPARLCDSLAAAARAGGAEIHTRTRVLGVEVADGRVRRVRTDRGDIDCEIVVNCGGMFAAEIGRMVGVRVPIVPMSHQYVVTDAFLPRRDTPLPTLRDPDLLVYYRQEVDGLVMGGYERTSAAWTAGPRAYDAIPADFNGRLLAPDWDRFAEIADNARIRVPALGDLGVRKLINGPEAFTPDNEFCLGETEVGGFFVAAGFCAHGIAGAGGIGLVMAEWITTGEPPYDLWHMDIRRFGRHYRSPSYTLARTAENYETYYDIRYPGQARTAGRPLRTSPVYPWHAAHGASFGEKAGWERVDHYESNARPDLPELAGLRPDGWAGRNWSTAVPAEHLATRRSAGLFDETSFAKIEVTGPQAAEFLSWACDNDVAREVGAVTYTQALNTRGGIECDFTVTRRAEDDFLIVTGTAFGGHDLAFLRRQAAVRGASVRIADVTGQFACFALWGPSARAVLSRLTADDLGFPFMSMRELTVGDVPVMALRVTFVGEHGWELYCSTEYGAALWRTLWEAGREHDVVAGGYRAIDSMRLEKGYRVWGADVGPETDPYEAGLGFCVKLDKPGGFCGRDALAAARERGPARRLRCLVLGVPGAVALGNEPVRVGDSVGDSVAGRVTSGGFGYTVRSSIAYAYLPVEHAEPGTKISVEVSGTWVDGTVAREPLFDPHGERVRSVPWRPSNPV